MGGTVVRTWSRRGVVVTWLVGGIVIAGLRGVPAGAVWTRSAPTEVTDRLPQVDVRAPGVFARSTRPSHELQVRYQVNATVLLPLFSLPITHRDNVGFALVTARDLRPASGDGVRGYELFAASYPARARGLNRMGFIREVVGLGRDGARWTAHFGALSSNPETRRDQVALDADESVQTYTVMDGYTDRTRAWSNEVRLQLTGSWSSPRVFYRALVPRWRLQQPDIETRSDLREAPAPVEPLGFLGIVTQSLRVAAFDVRRGRSPRKFRYPFTHKGERMYLWLRGTRVDRGRQRELARERVLDPEAVLHRFDYRILDRRGDAVQSFSVWAELPPGGHGRESSPIVPVSFVFKAKSFLELEAVRVSRRTSYPSP